MLIGVDELQTTTTSDPELLIEEARALQRRRQKRRTTALSVAGILVILGVGAYRIARSEYAAPAPRPQPSLAVARQPAVIYEKVETVATNPHHPTFRRTGEIWFSPAAPWAYRELLTTAGGPTVEVGARLGHDPRLGAEQLVLTYLYDAKANTIYETGADAAPTPTLFPPRFYQRLLPRRGVRVAGTRLFEGHKVYVVHVTGPSATSPRSTYYFDTSTHQPLLQVETDFPGSGYIIRVLAYKTLPATETNLDLTSLASTHTGARVAPWPPPPRIDDLYGAASQMPRQAGGFAGASDLGPVGG
jgi:hypothetical protein